MVGKFWLTQYAEWDEWFTNKLLSMSLTSWKYWSSWLSLTIIAYTVGVYWIWDQSDVAGDLFPVSPEQATLLSEHNWNDFFRMWNKWRSYDLSCNLFDFKSVAGQNYSQWHGNCPNIWSRIFDVESTSIFRRQFVNAFSTFFQRQRRIDVELEVSTSNRRWKCPLGDVI